MQLNSTKINYYASKIFSSIISKIIISILISIITSSVILNFSIETATFKYSIIHGFRIPSEGFPYIKKLIIYSNIIILFIFLSILLSILFFHALFFSALIFFKSIFSKNNSNTNGAGNLYSRTSSLRKKYSKSRYFLIFLLSLALICTICLIESFAIYKIFYDNNSYDKNLYKYVTLTLIIFLGVPLAINIFYGAISYIYTFLVSSIITFCISILFFFNHNNYSNFLREIGYGGGVEIFVESKQKITYNQILILRTNSYLITRNKDEKSEIKEINLNEIETIKYKKQTIRSNIFQKILELILP